MQSAVDRFSNKLLHATTAVLLAGLATWSAFAGHAPQNDGFGSPRERSTAGFASGEEPTEPSAEQGPRLAQATTTRYQIGVIVRSGGGPCRGLSGTAPVPLEWPEQKIRILEEDVTPGVRAGFRQISPTVKQLVVKIPFLAAGEEARALVTFEIQRYSLDPPADPQALQMPKKLPSNLRKYLGSSPGIESTHRTIRTHAREITQGRETAWEQVEAIYDWTREKVRYRNGPFKGALAALRAGEGDCEELSSLFIALCRANKIPARTVWVPGHCYPEFYLEDESGSGHWIPCQAAGDREFGGISEGKPILQKGDNFRVPEKRKTQRYVAETLTGKGGRPQVEFVRRRVD